MPDPTPRPEQSSLGDEVPALSNRSDHGRRWINSSIAVAVSLILYVLSLGPAVWATDTFLSRNRAWLHSAYAPVIWLAEHTPLGGPLEWYVCLWIS